MADKKKQSPRSFLANNTSLKLISLLFAIILWGFVTNSTNPERTKNIENVPIVVQGIEALEDKGFIIRDDLTKILPTVDIKVNVKNSDYRLVNKNVVLATIDVSEISMDGTNSVTVVPNFSNLVDVSLESIEPHSITLTVDKIINKEVPVVINKTGELKEGLISVAPQYPQTLSLTGSSYYLDRIENAVVDIDLSTLNDGAKISTICRYEDKDEKIINFEGKKVDVDMDVQTKKEVSIIATDSIINKDKLADGYQFASVSTGKIIICGHNEVLNGIDELKTENIDLAGKDSTFTSTPVSLILPEGITVLAGQDAPQAKIEIKEQTQTINVTRFITVTGLNANLGASITSGDQTVQVSSDGTAQIKATVSVTGAKLTLDNLKETDVIVRLSLLDKGVGTYDLSPVVALNPALVNNLTAQLVSPTQVSVSINTLTAEE